MRDHLLKRSLKPLCGLLSMLLAIPTAHSLSLEQNPLFLTTGGKPNILVILDNSNSMDEDATGAAVGSNHASSKSEIARSVIGGVVDANVGRINMGLMAYKQGTLSSWYVHNSPYDVSYDPAHYDPMGTHYRDDATHKKYRIPNPTSAGNYIHYNVALPFYASSNQGNGFCYSPTAVASHDFDNGENPSTGPWDSYRCFSTKTGTANGVVSPLPGGGIQASETALGYSGLYGTYTFSPTDSDFAQGILDFGPQNTWNYVARAWFNNASPGRGYLHTPIKDLDATQATSIKNKLKCNIPGTPAPCNASGIQNAGLTPLEGTLLTARDYFAGGWNVATEGYVASCYPLPTSCGKNFVVLVTDGMPSTNADGSITGSESDKLTRVANAAAALKSAGIETYVVGFALPNGVDPTTLNTVAAAGGTVSAYSASDLTSLTTALNAIFSNIESKVSSGSAIAANSTQLNTETLIYQARFSSLDWSGEVIAYPLDNAGAIGTARWSTNDTGAIPAAGSRRIFTSNAAVAGGIEFTRSNFSSFDATMQSDLNKNYAGTTDSLGQDRVDWLRGTAVTGMRTRSRILGDIINSDPIFVGAQNYGYSVLPLADGGAATYESFIERKKLRRKVLYVGSNDGMLHALDADTGQEIFAYVPKLLSSRLSRLTDSNYGKTAGPSHYAYVDGTFGVGDAYIDTGDGTGTRWHTILLGTLGAGGKGVFALDITEMPASGDPSTSTVYFGASHVLWEFTHAETGNVYGPPRIARLQDGTWAAVFGNGYNSTSYKAQLFAVNLQTGAVHTGFPIDTEVGNSTTENGMGPVSGYASGDRIFGDDTDSGATLGDGFYAGDLWGNVWRFTYKSGSWQSAYKTGSTPKALFQALDSSSNKQPITSQIEIGEPPLASQGVMLFFGTGRYFLTGDTSNLSKQAVYGLWDNGSNTAITKSDLVQQSVTHQDAALAKDATWRVISANTVTYTGGGAKKGWYLDLLPPSGTAEGERSVTKAGLHFGRVIFSTIIPSTDPCTAGGTSWLIELDQKSGARLDFSVFDMNNDNLFNNSDYVNAGGTMRPVSGKRGTVGITKAPAWLYAGDKAYKIQSGTDTSGANGGILVTKNKGGTKHPRMSWRQLFPADK